MKFMYEVPESRKIRLIINSDAKNEVDDQYAIVHALLTPKFDIKGIIAAHFTGAHDNNEALYTSLGLHLGNTMEDSYEEIVKILRLMNMEGHVPVFKGAEKPMINEQTPCISEGAKHIIEEAMKEDSRPLFVTFQGTITDLASAYLMEPAIANRLTAIWIAGAKYPEGGSEFNMGVDINAANVVFDSPIPLWQVPSNVYSNMRVSIAELFTRVKPYGEIGEYLYQQLIHFNMVHTLWYQWPKGESWSLGDSPVVSLLLDEHEASFTMREAPRISPEGFYLHRQNERKIRVYDYVDSRFTLEDFFAKLALYFTLKS